MDRDSPQFAVCEIQFYRDEIPWMSEVIFRDRIEERLAIIWNMIQSDPRLARVDFKIWILNPERSATH